MNVFIGEKLILTQPVDKLRNVGEAFEIANVVDDFVVLRNAKTKIAVGVCNIIDIEKHFTKVNEFVGWTQWTRLINARGDVIAFYRTNGKKVQVRTVDGFKGEATCNKCDTFNLWFGIRLAHARMQLKIISKVKTQCEDVLKEAKKEEHDNKVLIKRIYASLDKENNEVTE